MTRRSFLTACAGCVGVRSLQRQTAGQPSPGALPGRVAGLRAVQGLPAEIVGAFRDPIAFQQASSGQYFVFDMRGHSVSGIDAAMTGSWPIVKIGGEAGRVLEPTAFALAANGTFVIADRPGARERIQWFGPGGALLGGFTLPGRPLETVSLNGIVLNGIGSLQFSGHSVFINQPETGALVSEYSMTGWVIRTFGTLRPTGHEDDRDVHLSLNAGLPLINPRGGFYFVFQTGVPVFRKLDDEGRLVFERHVEGPELDPIVNNLPNTWPRRKGAGDRLLPIVPPVIRTAAVDAAGRLWVSMAGVPFTYVYDAQGERVGVVQFRAAGIVMPAGLFFAPDGRLLVAPGCYIFDTRGVAR